MRMLLMYLLLLTICQIGCAFSSKKFGKSGNSLHANKNLSPQPQVLYDTARSTGIYEPLNSFPEDYFADEDSLESELAKDLYNQLKGDSPILSVDQFVAWDDIQDILTRDVIDLDTVNIILNEVGVKSDGIHFDQFVEAVELVNQVSEAIEGDWGEGGDDEESDDADDEIDEAFLREIEQLDQQPESSYLQ